MAAAAEAAAAASKPSRPAAPPHSSSSKLSYRFCSRHFLCIVDNCEKKKKIIFKMLMFFTAPVTGDVWLQDGQIKEEEEVIVFIS